MGFRRFLIDSADIVGEDVFLSEEESNHIRTVLRLEEGAEIELFDGSGLVYSARIRSLDKRVKTEIVDRFQAEEEKKVTVWLGQAMLKGNKVDELIPKCNELGLDILAPFESSRCQGRLNKARAAKKKERWQRVVESSCKQCGRVVPLQLAELTNFSDMVKTLGEKPENELRLFFWEEEDKLFLKQLDFALKYELIRVILGPEGGFSEEEAQLAKSYGWQPVSLGQRVLRAETATVAAVSLVQFLAGNLGE